MNMNVPLNVCLVKVIKEVQSPCSWGDSRLVPAKRRYCPVWSHYTSPSPNSFPFQCSWGDLHRLCWNFESNLMLSTQAAKIVVLKEWCWIDHLPAKNPSVVSLCPQDCMHLSMAKTKNLWRLPQPRCPASHSTLPHLEINLLHATLAFSTHHVLSCFFSFHIVSSSSQVFSPSSFSACKIPLTPM